MTSSESPTHPDAPRAGGETPNVLADLERYLDAYRDAIIAEHDAGPEYAMTDPDVDRAYERVNNLGTELRAKMAANQTAAASLLARHRDGERAEPDAWLVVIHVRRGGSNTTARYFYSERETAEREAGRKCNAIGDSFAQIFPLFAASPDADGPAPPSPERASK